MKKLSQIFKIIFLIALSNSATSHAMNYIDSLPIGGNGGHNGGEAVSPAENDTRTGGNAI